MIVAVLAIAWGFISFSSPSSEVASIKSATFTFGDLLDAIEWVESKGDPWAVGDNGAAVGAYQIHKIYVDDVNRIICKHRLRVSTFKYSDRYDRYLSRVMVTIYLEEYGGISVGDDLDGFITPEKTEKCARIHNGGPWGWRKESTKAYWAKVKAKMEGAK